MANEIRNKYRSSVTAQASAAISADAYSTGTQDVIDVSASSGDYVGCQALDCYINVTSAPSTAATCELYMEASYDGGSNYADEEYCLSCEVPTSTGRYHLGLLTGLPGTCKLKIKAIDYGFTASLEVVPILFEVQ